MIEKIEACTKYKKKTTTMGCKRRVFFLIKKTHIIIFKNTITN